MNIMKNILLAFCIVFAAHTAWADDADFIADELFGSGALAENIADTKETASVAKISDEEKNAKDDNSAFDFITQPIAKMMNSGDKAAESNSDSSDKSELEQKMSAADDGDVSAQIDLGYMYLYGVDGVERDLDKAFHYYSLAAEQNNPTALHNLGSLYYNGLGTKRNTKVAVELFKKSAELGNDDAKVNLAFIYLTGKNKDDAVNSTIVELLDQAQTNGDQLARFMLGYAYYSGFAVEKDYKKAFKLIKAAASGEAQFDEAQLVLADMYRNGKGTVQNFNRAISAYRAAVNQGNLEAVTELADIYTEGKLCPQNLVLAHALYNVAAAQDLDGAAQKRDELSEKMQLEALTQAHEAAQSFEIKPSKLTEYVRQTYGQNVRDLMNAKPTKTQNNGK